ncbi:hypothetical protein Chor_012751, partial [Crotalus horridus]
MAAQQHPNNKAALSKEVEDMRCPLQVPVKMEIPCQADDSAKEGEGKGLATIPSETSEDFTRAASRVKQELAEEPPQSWECQWQRVLEVVTVPIEMVIVNSSTVDQAQSEAKHLHKENKQKTILPEWGQRICTKESWRQRNEGGGLQNLERSFSQKAAPEDL